MQRLLGLQAPSVAAVGESITLEVVIESRDDLDVMTRVTDDSGEVVAARRVSLQQGINAVSFQVRPKESGLRHYDVSLEGNDRTVSATVRVSRTVVGVIKSETGLTSKTLLLSTIQELTSLRLAFQTSPLL